MKMLYKYPGPHDIHGDKFDYIIVEDEGELKAALKDGWAETTEQAKKPKAKPKAKKNANKA